jgi:DNA (cytosine-5)-methyltransferase 1
MTVPKQNSRPNSTEPVGDGLTIVSLFAGAGGLEIAACSTGNVKRIVSTDSNATFLKTTETNMATHFPEVEHVALVADVSELTVEKLRELAGGQVDVVMGGPPCDDFTKFGRRSGVAGGKGALIHEFRRLVCALKPSVFLFENVPNLAQQFTEPFGRFLSLWIEDNWHHSWQVLKASDYGAPTQRKRIIMVGSRNGVILERFLFPRPTHGDGNRQMSLFEAEERLSPVTVGDVLAGLPDAGSPEAKRMGVMNHTARNHRPATVAHIKTIPPAKFVPKSRRYRAPWDGLCWSLTAGTDDSTKSYIHPVLDREMSVREYARIHCFPDTWFFEGSLNNGIKQVANAVPIPLGVAVWRQIHQTIQMCFAHVARLDGQEGG